MARENDTGRIKNIDDQVNRLAQELKDRGVAPARDLWGDIDQSISAVEERRIRPAGYWRRAWPQVAAVAAVVTLLIAAGWWALPRGTTQSRIAGPVAVATTASPAASGLDVIAQALTELNLALAADPDNRSLGNLSLMLHQRRGRMLRQNTEMRLNGS